MFFLMMVFAAQIDQEPCRVLEQDLDQPLMETKCTEEQNDHTLRDASSGNCVCLMSASIERGTKHLKSLETIKQLESVPNSGDIPEKDDHEIFTESPQPRTKKLFIPKHHANYPPNIIDRNIFGWTLEDIYQYLIQEEQIPPAANPKIEKINGGLFTSEIIGVKTTVTPIEKFTYLIKKITQCKDGVVFGPDRCLSELLVDYSYINPQEIIEDWGNDMLCSTLPLTELNNLLILNNDKPILKYNLSALYNKENQRRIRIGLLEKAFIFESVLYGRCSEGFISVLHGAQGCSLYEVLVKNEATPTGPTKSLEIMAQLGQQLAEFHLTTKRVHLDFHAKNIFVSDKYFTLIDNHSMAYSLPFANDPKILSYLFDYDKKRLRYAFGCWSQNFRVPRNWQELINTYEEAYEQKFFQLSQTTPYFLIPKTSS